MRKLLWGFLFLPSFFASAQDLQTVQRSIASNDYSSAKKQIDSLFLLQKNNPDAPAWYYKGRIYTEMVRQYNKSDYNSLKEAFRAYKRYQELDPKNKLMQLNDNVDLFQLYDLSYNTAADFYNEKRYDLACGHFKNALEVEEYISKKGYSFQGKSFPLMDTSLIDLTGSSAYLSGREEEAIPYFERLAEARVAGEDYKGVYGLLYQYYSKKNDPQKAARYLAAGRELIADNEYWIKLELGNAPNQKEKFARYEKLLEKYPDNFGLLMDYAIELFNYVYADTPPSDFENRQNRLQVLLTRAIAADPGSALANFVMSQHIYNQVYYMEQTLRSLKDETQADQAKKKLLSAKLDQKYDDLLTFSSKAYEVYSQEPKPANRDNCRKVLNQLITCYQKKKQSDKVSYYQQKLKEL